MPDEPPCAGSLAAIEPAKCSMRLNLSGVEMFGRQHAVAHRDAADGAAELGAAAGRESAGPFQLLDGRRRQDQHVGPLAAEEALLERADGVEDQLDLPPGGRVNSGAARARTFAAPALMTLILAHSCATAVTAGRHRYADCGASSPDERVGIAADILAADQTSWDALR